MATQQLHFFQKSISSSKGFCSINKFHFLNDSIVNRFSLFNYGDFCINLVLKLDIIVNFLSREMYLGNLNEAIWLAEDDTTLKVTSISTNEIASFRSPRKIFLKRKLTFSNIMINGKILGFVIFLWKNILIFNIFDFNDMLCCKR